MTAEWHFCYDANTMLFRLSVIRLSGIKTQPYIPYTCLFFYYLRHLAFIPSQQASKDTSLNGKPGLETLFTSNINAWCWLGPADRKAALLPLEGLQ